MPTLLEEIAALKASYVKDNQGTTPAGMIEVLFGLVEKVAENQAAPGYKVYRALITQSGTNIPEMVVLENTLGIIPIGRYNSVGQYSIRATGIYTLDKTTVQLTSGNFSDGVTRAKRTSAHNLTIETFSNLDYEIHIDGVLDATIEIKVYN